MESLSPYRDSNQAFPVYKSEALPLQPSFSLLHYSYFRVRKQETSTSTLGYVNIYLFGFNFTWN
jgi:hypothetical protein